MSYVVVVSYMKKQDIVNALVLDDNYNVKQQLSHVTVVDFVKMVQKANATPLNFSIPNSRLEQDCGDFARLDRKGACILLAECVNEAGKTVGYKLLAAQTGDIQILSEETIKVIYDKSGGTFTIQNAIIRKTDKKFSISCYPNKKFAQLKVATQQKATGKKVAQQTKAQPEKKAEYDPQLILQGKEKNPTDAISKDDMKKITHACVDLLKEKIHKGKPAPKTEDEFKYGGEDMQIMANFITWILQIEKFSFDKCLYTFLDVMDEMPIEKVILLDKEFTKYCPSFDDFVSKYASFCIENEEKIYNLKKN